MQLVKSATLENAFKMCEKQGKFITLEDVDVHKIRSTLAIARADLASAEALRKIIAKDSAQWSSVYKLYYDALHELLEALLRFDKIKVTNHKCLFAFACEKYPDLLLSWDFFEKMRTKRNGINYYGSLASAEDWKIIEIEFNLCFKKLENCIEDKLKFL